MQRKFAPFECLKNRSPGSRRRHTRACERGSHYSTWSWQFTLRYRHYIFKVHPCSYANRSAKWATDQAASYLILERRHRSLPRTRSRPPRGRSRARRLPLAGNFSPWRIIHGRSPCRGLRKHCARRNEGRTGFAQKTVVIEFPGFGVDHPPNECRRWARRTFRVDQSPKRGRHFKIVHRAPDGARREMEKKERARAYVKSRLAPKRDARIWRRNTRYSLPPRGLIRGSGGFYRAAPL